MFRSSFRSISDSQLNTSLYLHLCPIYLVVFKGSYYLSVWEQVYPLCYNNHIICLPFSQGQV